MQYHLEKLLWSSRLLVLIAVAAGLVVAIGIFVFVSLDVVHLLSRIVEYAAAGLGETALAELRVDIVSAVVEIVDGYLLAAVMIIFALGLYELFVSRIDLMETSELAQRLLLVHSLDDLKDRLAKVVILILVVKFFQYALGLKYGSPIELLYLAIGIALIAGALYVTRGKEH